MFYLWGSVRQLFAIGLGTRLRAFDVLKFELRRLHG